MPKRGRPKGSKNNDYTAAVDEIPAACPHCDSKAITQRPGPVRAVVFDGTAPNGKKYATIEWRRMQCSDCLRTFMKRSYVGQKDNQAKNTKPEVTLQS